MLIGGIVLGLVLGLLAGGSLERLTQTRLRWTGLIFAALLGRYLTEWAIGAGIGWAETLRAPLYGAAFGALLVGLWANRAHPGFSLAFAGIGANTLVILANGGRMPVWEPSLAVAGFSPQDVGTAFHTILPAALDANFLLRLGFLGDVLPIPLPFVRNVASIGDVFLSAGLGFFLFAAVLGAARDTGFTGLVARRWRGRARRPAVSSPSPSRAASPPAWRRPLRSSDPWSLALAQRARPLPGAHRRPASWAPRSSFNRSPGCPGSLPGSASIPMSGWPSTARSRPCGRARSSASSATASTRSRCSSWCST